MLQISVIDEFLANLAKGASIPFAIFFIASGCLHVWQSQKYQCWPFTWPLPPACILISAAFICREITSRNDNPEDLASPIQGLFYAATPTFALPLYVFLIRLLETPPKLVRIRTGYFFCLVSCMNTAVITTIGQGASTYFSSGQRQNAMASGLDCLKASFILQLVFNTAFIYILLLFKRRLDARYMPAEFRRDRRTAILTGTFLTLMGLILVRNIYRTIQIFVSPTSALWTSEAYFWVFEACTMLLFNIVFHVMHPAKSLDVRNGWECRAKRMCSQEEEGMRMDDETARMFSQEGEGMRKDYGSTRKR